MEVVMTADRHIMPIKMPS